MQNKKRIHIGTSGWHYDHWRGPFYPEDLPKERFLRHYGNFFDTVEVNNSFYQLPKNETFERWRRETGDDFIFSIKASRYITHMKKLKDPGKTLPPLLNGVDLLKEKLGPILFQLPPGWKPNPERLHNFLSTLPKGYRYAFEFRNVGWHNSETIDMLQQHGAAFCIFELAGQRSSKTVTADFIYIRLHGPGKESYQGSYTSRDLSGWAGAFSSWANQGKEIFCYFDNDERGFAAQDALKLNKMIGQG